MADDRGGAWNSSSSSSADPHLRVGACRSGQDLHRGTGRIGQSWLGQQGRGGPSVTSQEIAAILAKKKPTPQDEATRGMNNALCGVRSMTSRAWVSHDGERQVGRQR